jgi:multiple antibiotic resistance protein
MKSLFLSFVSIFVAMDAIGTLPLFLALTEGLESRKRTKLILEGIAAGAIVGIVFMFVGEKLFQILGITIADFRVAGGLLLLVFAIHDLLFAKPERRKTDTTDLGVVPIGIPLLVGPAVLTSLLLSIQQHGAIITVLAFALNLLLAFFAFYFANLVTKVLGAGGARGVGKVASLLLAALAVMMIRSGIQQMFAGKNL